MQNRIILTALLLALSTTQVLAEDTSSSQATETAAVQSADSVLTEMSSNDKKKLAENDGKAKTEEASAKEETKKDDTKDEKKVEKKVEKKADKKAEKKKEPKEPKATSTKASSKGGGGGPIGAAGNFITNGAKRMAATTTGFALGFPIAAVRMTIHEDGEQAKSLPILNESSFPPFQWASRVFFIPSAVFSGFVQAPVFSATNAWRESDDNPFSKESIFLGNYEDRTLQQ